MRTHRRLTMHEIVMLYMDAAARGHREDAAEAVLATICGKLRVRYGWEAMVSVKEVERFLLEGIYEEDEPN